MTPGSNSLNHLRKLLCELQDQILSSVIGARKKSETDDWAEIAATTAADTIYRIDAIAEEPLTRWMRNHWPSDQPVELVMEGIEDADSLTFPAGSTESVWKLIIDPIDGTRGLMYDKRPAWSLAGLAPQSGRDTKLSDIVVAAMTELPTTKQWRADQLSAVKGCGPDGVVAEAIDVRDGNRTPFKPMPSRASHFKHGFAATLHAFPQGKGLLSQLEEDLWAELHGAEPEAAPLVFDDQYISTGGQLYELAVGHDRMQGDLRPLAFAKLGLDLSIKCHPYDICTALVAAELGVVVEKPDGTPPDAPLDTTSPVAWMGYANEELASLVRPVLKKLIAKQFG